MENNRVVIYKWKQGNDYEITMIPEEDPAEKAELPEFFQQFKDLTVRKRLHNALHSLGSKKKLSHRIADCFFWFRIRKQDAGRVHNKGILLLKNAKMQEAKEF